MTVVDIHALTQPISGPSPCGEDAKYEFCFEIMEAEVKKFGSLFGETVDWRIVENNAQEVLKLHSKDLKAACYLARAIVHRQAFSGLKVGLEMLLAILEEFGDSLHPRRKRGRDGAIEWLMGQLEGVIPKLSTTQSSWQELSEIEDLIRKVGSRYSDCFPDTDVHFYGLCSVINPVMQRMSVDEPANEERKVDREVSVEKEPASTVHSEHEQNRTPQVDQSTANKPSVVKPEYQSVDIDTDFTSVSASQKTLKKVAEFILKHDVKAPLAYRINRFASWVAIDELPPHDDEGKTPICLAISQDALQEYQDSAEKKADEEKIKKLEKTLANVPFWLTGHYFLAQMMLANDWSCAAEAVKQSVLEFIDRFPGIEALSFSNDVPFLSGEASKWLHARDSKKVSMASIAIEASDDSEPVTLDNFSGVVTSISQRLISDASGRAQFINYLQIIKAYHQVGLFPLCMPYLEKLWPIKQEMNLDQWEPELCSQLDSLISTTFDSLFPNMTDMPDKYREWVLNN